MKPTADSKLDCGDDEHRIAQRCGGNGSRKWRETLMGAEGVEEAARRAVWGLGRGGRAPKICYCEVRLRPVANFAIFKVRDFACFFVAQSRPHRCKSYVGFLFSVSMYGALYDQKHENGVIFFKCTF